MIETPKMPSYILSESFMTDCLWRILILVSLFFAEIIFVCLLFLRGFLPITRVLSHELSLSSKCLRRE